MYVCNMPSMQFPKEWSSVFWSAWLSEEANAFQVAIAHTDINVKSFCKKYFSIPMGWGTYYSNSNTIT